MNERMKQLAEQAGIAVWGDAVYMYDPKDTLDSTVIKKFAELIVRDVVEQIITRERTDGEWYQDDIFKQFFGVEQ